MVSAFISFLNHFNLFQSSLRIKPKFFVKWWKLHSKYSISELLFLILLENFTEFAVVFRLSSYCGHSFVRSSFPVNFLNDIAYKSLIFNVENQRANVIGKFSNVQFIHLFFCNLLIKWKFSKTSTKQSFNWIFFFFLFISNGVGITKKMWIHWRPFGKHTTRRWRYALLQKAWDCKRFLNKMFQLLTP